MAKEKRKNRSDSYQHLLLEIAISSDLMESFGNIDSISSKLDPFAYSEELIDLKDELEVEFWRIVNTLLTPRQAEVISLYCSGMTQMEIAKKLGVNQSSITKSLNGNVDYSSKETGSKKTRSYGGTKRKIKKIIEQDEKIQEILAKMREVREERW